MGQFKLLGSRRFWPLFITQFLGAFNDNIYKNSLVIWITFSLASLNGGDARTLVIMAAGIFILPFFLFSAIAGQLADQFEKSRLVRLIKILEIIVMLLAGFGFYWQNVSILMLVLFLMGTQSSLFGPIKYAILPQHLPARKLTGANGLIQTGTFLAILSGTILGGVLVAIPVYGTTIVCLITVSLAMLGWLASRFIPAATPYNNHGVIRWNLFAETINMIKFAQKNKNTFIAILGISWFWAVGSTLLSLVPDYGKNILAGNAHVVTLLLAGFSTGIGIGSLLCERLTQGEVTFKLVAIAVFGISLSTLDLFLAGIPETTLLAPHNPLTATEFLASINHWRILLDHILLGIAGGLYIVPLYTVLQQYSQPAHRARNIAANNIFNALSMVLAALLTIIALQYLSLSIPQLYLCLSISNVFVALIIFWPFLRKN